MYKLRPFLNFVIPKPFQQVFKPNMQLAIDETLVKFKGKVHFRQFNIAFQSSQGESSSGYLLNSKIYTGMEGDGVQRDVGRKAVMTVIEP